MAKWQVKDPSVAMLMCPNFQAALEVLVIAGGNGTWTLESKSYLYDGQVVIANCELRPADDKELNIYWEDITNGSHA
jgi:hypothetical protein